MKIHRTGFFYYYTTLPIIRTGWKISLHLQIYVLVDLKNMGRNIYKTSTYNRNLRVSRSLSIASSLVVKVVKHLLRNSASKIFISSNILIFLQMFFYIFCNF